MLLDYIRLLRFKTTLDDISLENQDGTVASAINLTPDDDYLLLGMPYPCNSFFLRMEEPNGARTATGTLVETTPYNAVGPVYEVQTLTFDKVPTQGAWKLALGVDETSVLAYNSNAAALQAALRLLPDLGALTVTGDYADGFVITFTGLAANPAMLTVEDSTLARIEPSLIQCELWDGSQWRAVVDVMDGTKLSGASLSKSGNVLFTPNKSYGGWQKITDPTTSTNSPEELEDMHIYDLYWMKIKWTGQIPSDVTLQSLGFAFTTSESLKIVRKDVDRWLPSFAETETGKTDWTTEIMAASKHVVNAFKKTKAVRGHQQIVRLDDVWLPTAYKTMALIYGSLGPAYLDEQLALEKQFKNLFNTDNITVDQDMNGRVSDEEKDTRTYTGVR